MMAPWWARLLRQRETGSVGVGFLHVGEAGERARTEAAGALVWEDAQTRVAMVVGPATALPALAAAPSWTVLQAGLLQAAAGIVLVGLRIRGTRRVDDQAPTIRAATRGAPAVRLCWVVRGTGCALWLPLPSGFQWWALGPGRARCCLRSGTPATGSAGSSESSWPGTW